MKPVRTETSNVTFVGEGCQELPGTRYLCDDVGTAYAIDRFRIFVQGVN